MAFFVDAQNHENCAVKFQHQGNLNVLTSTCELHVYEIEPSFEIFGHGQYEKCAES